MLNVEWGECGKKLPAYRREPRQNRHYFILFGSPRRYEPGNKKEPSSKLTDKYNTTETSHKWTGPTQAPYVLPPGEFTPEVKEARYVFFNQYQQAALLAKKHGEGGDPEPEAEAEPTNKDTSSFSNTVSKILDNITRYHIASSKSHHGSKKHTHGRKYNITPVKILTNNAFSENV